MKRIPSLLFCALFLVAPVEAAPPTPACAIQWSTFLGGQSPVYYERTRVATAPDGDLIVATATTDTAWVMGLTQNRYSFGLRGQADIVVLRMSGDGSTVRWATILGGSGDDDGIGTNQALGVLPDNSIVICGVGTRGFPTTPAAYDTIPPAVRYKPALFRISADGDSLLFSTFFGGSESGEFYALAVDPAGRIVTCGRTYSTNFPTSNDAYQPTLNGGGREAFISTFTFDGALLRSTLFGGPGNDEFLAVAIDLASHRITAAGYAASPHLYGSTADLDTTLEGISDGMLAQFDDDLTTLEHFTYIGGSSGNGTYSETVYAMALDADGAPVAILNTESDSLPVVPPGWNSTRGSLDPYVFKLSSDWASLEWATYAGRIGSDQAYALAPIAGDWIITGTSDSIDTEHPFQPDQGGFLTRLSPASAELKSVFSFGSQVGYGLAVQANGYVVVAGDVTSPTDFPLVAPTVQPTYGGGPSDGFLLALDPDYACMLGVEEPVPSGSASGMLAIQSQGNDHSSNSIVRVTQRMTGAVSLSLHDVTGRAIWSQTLPPSGPGSRSVTIPWNAFDHGAIPDGVYFLSGRLDRHRASSRIVVVR